MNAPTIPLARVLAMAYRQIIDELHARLASHGYRDVSPTFGYVLLALREAPKTITEIASLLDVSKQAASKLVDSMASGGYVSRTAHGDDARAKAVAITARGSRFLSTVEKIYQEIEGEWTTLTSKKRLEAIRHDLQAIVEARHAGVLPPIRPTR